MYDDDDAAQEMTHGNLEVCYFWVCYYYICVCVWYSPRNRSQFPLTCLLFRLRYVSARESEAKVDKIL